jgi:hypothetical protein
MDSFVVHRFRRWQYRRAAGYTRRPLFTDQQLHGMGLHRYEAPCATRRKPHLEDHR